LALALAGCDSNASPGGGGDPGAPGPFTQGMVSAGGNYAVAIDNDGRLWVWGSNFDGQLGIGSTGGEQTTPVRVGTDSDWRYVSAGSDHTLAIRSDGTLWAWGSNANNRTGLGGSGNQTSPAQVGSYTGWYRVSAGRGFTIGIRYAGGANYLYTWGYNATYRTGRGTTSGTPTPLSRMLDAGSGWTYAAAGLEHGMVINAGERWAWGWGVPTGTGIPITDMTRNRTAPYLDAESPNWYRISARHNHSAGIRADGSLWAWGVNNNGQLGIAGIPTGGVDAHSPVPARVGTLTGWTQVSAGGSLNNGFTVGIRNGHVYAWGQNTNGRTGLGATSGNTVTPARVSF